VASNFIIIGTILAERLMYLPSVFFLLLLAIPLSKLPKRACVIVVGLLLALACVRTFTYVRHWTDREGFYAYSAMEQPKSVRIHLLYGEYFLEDGHVALDKARAEFAEATRIAPDDPNSWDARGLAEEKAENWAKAVEYFLKAYKLQASMPRAQKVAHAAQILKRMKATTGRS
jgi:tetratricopeptide (TPR) repeat protein